MHFYLELLRGQTLTFEKQSSIRTERYSLPPEATATTERRYRDGSLQTPLVLDLATYGVLTAVLIMSTRLWRLVYWYTWGDPKIPGIVKKKDLNYLYKFETLVPFEVLPLRLDAAIPAPLPMLETLSKIFNGNAVKGRQQIAGGPWQHFRWERCWGCCIQSQGEYFEGD